MSQDLAELMQTLVALSEPAQRVSVVAETARQMTPERFVAILTAALEEITHGKPAARILLDVFHAALDAGAIGYDLRSALYHAAKDTGIATVTSLMLAPPPQAEQKIRRDPPGSLAAAEKPLGVRTWMARRATGDTLDRLLCDPDPRVIENVLQNPKLIERDAVAIVARRPNYPDVIAAVSRSPRWSRRYRVRRAIVFNPYTPVDLSLRHLPFLNRADLRAVAQDAQLHAQLRASAQALVQHRPPVRGDEARVPDPGAAPAIETPEDRIEDLELLEQVTGEEPN